MASQGKLAMSLDFLKAFSGLPRPQQTGVRSMIEKFEANPNSSGLNYERIASARDSKMRSLRIDQAYRAIVLKPETGNVHLLLWADKHDDAYNWAARHECSINPQTGAMQIYAPQMAVPPVETPPEQPPRVIPEEPKGPFAALRDRQLMRLGVPQAMVEEVRSLKDDLELDSLKERLPQEGYEALFYLCAGDSYEKVVRDREFLDRPPNLEDYEAALNRDQSKASFVVIESDEELEGMLNAPLEHWRVFLHPSQRRFVERDWKGPVRLIGGAGTGKTVVAMHRARWLVRQSEESKILFFTFNRNLATDIRNNLLKICKPEEMQRIEVVNIDAWLLRFLRTNGYRFEILYGRDEQAWKAAMAAADPDLDYPRGFFWDEWEQVISLNGITTEAEYLKVTRMGRGTRISRAARRKLWPVFEEYRIQLAEKGAKEVGDAYRDAAALVAKLEEPLPYTSIIVDEAQDIGSQAFRLVRAIGGPERQNDLFITGDGHQRIYYRPVVLAHCGIRIRGRAQKLTLNYRTTEQTRSWAAALLEGRDIDDLDGGLDTDRSVRSLTKGPHPAIRNFETRDAQSEAISTYLRDLQAQGQPLEGVCIVARTTSDRDDLQRSLEVRGIETVVMDRKGDDPDRRGVRLATMHRVKGLEFDRVVLASVNSGKVPLLSVMNASGHDQETWNLETRERSLVYVAATRAKREVLVCSYGEPSEFLR